MVSKSKIHPILVTGITLLFITGVIASLDWHGISLRRLIALGAVAIATTLLGMALNSRQLAAVATRFVGRAIVRAPRQAWYNGYGTGAGDALKGLEETVPNIRRLEESTHDLAGR